MEVGCVWTFILHVAEMSIWKRVLEGSCVLPSARRRADRGALVPAEPAQRGETEAQSWGAGADSVGGA